MALSNLVDDITYMQKKIIDDLADKQGYYNSARNIYNDYKYYSAQKGINDKYKHAVMNCRAAQNGKKSEDTIAVLSLLKELKDISFGGNTVAESDADYNANILGRRLGRENPEADCDALVQKYIPKYYK